MKPARLAEPRTVAELMVEAYALEREAHQRYLEFADIMESHNNLEVAALFRSIAAQESVHAAEIQRRMGWAQPPQPLARLASHAPELEQAHYLMQPWHVLKIAIAAERRAHDFFDEIAQEADDEELRAAAIQLREEETEHLALLGSWLSRVPEPRPDWDDDPDPPRYTD